MRSRSAPFLLQALFRQSPCILRMSGALPLPSSRLFLPGKGVPQDRWSLLPGFPNASASPSSFPSLLEAEAPDTGFLPEALFSLEDSRTPEVRSVPRSFLLIWDTQKARSDSGSHPGYGFLSGSFEIPGSPLPEKGSFPGRPPPGPPAFPSRPPPHKSWPHLRSRRCRRNIPLRLPTPQALLPLHPSEASDGYNPFRIKMCPDWRCRLLRPPGET